MHRNMLLLSSWIGILHFGKCRSIKLFFMVRFMSLNVLSVKWATIRVILGKEINSKVKKN